MEWSGKYDAAGFEEAMERELACGAAAVTARRGDASAYKVWVSTARAARETAEQLFDMAAPPEATPLLDDVPLRAFRETGEKHSLRLWKARGIAQWYAGGGRQAESRKETMKRAGEFADLLEKEDRDCIVITRGLAMRALTAVLRRRGYVVEGGRLIHAPLDRLRAARQILHCGGCNHNCLLTSPRCDVGRNKAKERKIA